MFLLILLLTFFSYTAGEEMLAGNICKISGRKGNWVLLVNKKPFYIKGVGCGKYCGSKGEDYLKLAKELGANTVRTWGTDQGTEEYLNKAREYGLMVIAGIWMNYADGSTYYSYISGKDYMELKKQEIIDYVNKFKNHPAILIWGIGNETIHFTNSEEERIAFCKYLNNIIKIVHKIDPAHPVMYVSAEVTAIPYIKKYVPALDIIGMNVYGSIQPAHNRCISSLNIPYIITEYGPPGYWDRPKDENGQAIEPPDYEKAVWYRDQTRQIFRRQGYNLGGVAFQIGESTEETLTWWNINYRNYKTASFHMLSSLYKSETVKNTAPTIKSILLSKTKDIKPGEKIKVSVKAIDSENDFLTYSYALSHEKTHYLQFRLHQEIPVKVTGTGPQNQLIIPEDLEEGIYRLYVFVTDSQGNIATANKSISITRRSQ